MFGLFKKKPPTKAGLAYREIETALKSAFKLNTLGGAGGTSNTWRVSDLSSGEFLFILTVWGLKEGSSEPCHDDNVDRLQIEVEALWSGKKEAERNMDAVQEAILPLEFKTAEWDQKGHDWQILDRFELDLKPNRQVLLAKLHDFADACRRAYDILENH